MPKIVIVELIGKWSCIILLSHTINCLKRQADAIERHVEKDDGIIRDNIQFCKLQTNYRIGH